MLDVPRELVVEVARLLRPERRIRGTRKGPRSLTCWYQALLVLVWFRTKGDIAVVGAGFGVSRSTAYRYRDEGVTVLSGRAPDLHETLDEVAARGWSHVRPAHTGRLRVRRRRPGRRGADQARERDIRARVAQWNENPTPFTWTKSADDILETPRRTT